MASLRYFTIPRAAELLGIQERTLRNYVNAADGRPGLVTAQRGGARLVDVDDAYRFLRVHAPRLADLRLPAGYSGKPGDEDRIRAAAALAWLKFRGIDVSRLFPNAGEELAQVLKDAPEMRAIASAATTELRQKASEILRGANAPPPPTAQATAPMDP